MDASIIPKGKSTEKGSHLPGVYVHRESGNKFITVEGEGGYIQADALNKPEWNGSWERVGDVPSRTELLESQTPKEVKTTKKG